MATKLAIRIALAALACAMLATCGGGGGAGTEPAMALCERLAPIDAACDGPTCIHIAGLWSGQFPLAHNVNGVSYADPDAQTADDSDAGTEAERQGGQYILMGARSNNHAHFRVVVGSRGPTQDVLLRLGIVAASKDVLIGLSYPLQMGTMELSADLDTDVPDSVKSGEAIRFCVFAGVDKNKSGTLDESERLVQGRLSFLVVSGGYYQKALADLKAVSTRLLELNLTMAYDYFQTFLNGQAPVWFPSRGTTAVQSVEGKWEEIRARYATSNPNAFDPTQERHVYSHKVGIDYRTYPYGNVGQYFFNRNEFVLRSALLDSGLMKEKIIKRLIAMKRAGDPFPRLRVAERFDRFFETDLYLAFGTVYVDASLFAVVDCSGGRATVTQMELRGAVWDYYDFNYSAAGEELPGIDVRGIFRAVAAVQAGHGTLSGSGTVGQAFESLVILDEPLADETWDTCPPPRPAACPMMAGDWDASTTYKWVCHGSFLPWSFSGTRVRTQSIAAGQGCGFPTLGPPVDRNGFISDDKFYYVRAALEAELPEAGIQGYSNRMFSGEGTLFASGRAVDVVEYGLVYGEVGGVPGRCSTSATGVWTAR
jgi:hypothetical protein